MQAAELPPLREHVGIDEKLQQTGLVIAEQADHAPVSPPLIEHRDHIARIRSAIDVVAEEHLDRPRRPELADIGIDAGADLAQQIGVPVDVADGVDAGLIALVMFEVAGLADNTPEEVAHLPLSPPATVNG